MNFNFLVNYNRFTKENYSWGYRVILNFPSPVGTCFDVDIPYFNSEIIRGILLKRFVRSLLQEMHLSKISMGTALTMEEYGMSINIW